MNYEELLLNELDRYSPQNPRHRVYKDEAEEDLSKDYVLGLVESVYESGDLEKLKHCLEELCFIHDVDFPDQDVRIKI